MSQYDKQGTVMQGVDNIVAMPQWYINFNLANLVKSGTTVDGAPIKDVALQNGNAPMFLKGTLSSLRTEVYVPGSVTRVKFILSFASGEMDYYDLNQYPPTPERCSIAGMQFGFDVNLSYEDVENSKVLPPDVQKTVSSMLQYLGPGAFTIQHLFMDLENAALDQYDQTVTVYPKDMPDSAREAFPHYLGTYMQTLSKAGGNTLGYAIAVPDDASIPATFPPTALKYVTNQYRGPDGALNTDLDTVNYLVMTEGRAFPGNLLPWWGDFVVPEDDSNGWYGSMALAKSLFLERFLLPRLGPLVTPHWELSNRTGTLDPGYTEKQGSLSPVSTWLGGTFHYASPQGHSHVTNTLSNDDAYFNMSVDVDLRLEPGTNTIVISRTTSFDIDVIHWKGLEGAALKDEYRIWYVVPLTVTVELIGVVDGKLQVAATTQTTQKPPNVFSDTPYFWYSTGAQGSVGVFTATGDTMINAVDNMIKLAVPEALQPGIVEVIENSLNLQPLIFPGNAELFMANPFINAEGDLLLGLQYKV